MARIKPSAIIDKRIGKHKLRAEQIGGVWYFSCDTLPGFAKQFEGVKDEAEALAEFERRASGTNETRKDGE